MEKKGEEKLALTAKEAADRMGVHVNTVRAMVEDGRLNGYKTSGENGHWRIPWSEVEAFMNKRGEEKNPLDWKNSIHYISDDIPSALKEGTVGNAALWDFVNRYYGIRSVFGSTAVHSDMNTYRNLIERKGFIWIGEGVANYMDAYGKNKNSTSFSGDKFRNLDTQYGFGVVKSPSIFDTVSYSLVPLLVVKDKDEKTWVVDGTLQQFFPDMEKGLVVLPFEKAEQLYIGLKIYSKEEFAELYSDPHISERFIEEAKRLESEKRETK